MHDHILRFASEAEAIAVLPAYRDGDKWDGSKCLPVRVVVAPAVVDQSDPEREVVVSPEGVLPGWWLVIAETGVDAALVALAGHACRLVADREASSIGAPAIRYAAPDLDAAAFAHAQVTPTFAGSGYYS